jgi:hypothetical protein
MKIAGHLDRSRSLRYHSALSAHIIIVAQHLDPGFSILAVAAGPTGALPLLSCIHPRELVTTRAVIPTAADMQTLALASQLTDMGTKPTSRRGRLPGSTVASGEPTPLIRRVYQVGCLVCTSVGT